MQQTPTFNKPLQKQEPPTPPSTRLEKWYSWVGDDGKLRMVGTVYGHPRFPDGSSVVTSPVVDWSRKLGIAKTMNTVYILVGHEKKRPNA